MTESESPRRSPWSIARDVGLVICAGILFVSFLPVVYLLLYAETWQGRIFGLTATLWLCAPFVATGAYKLRRHRKVCAGMIAFSPGLPLLFTLVLFGAAPSGMPSAGARVGSVFLNGSYERASLANLLPEIDQIKLGVELTPYYDTRTNDTQRAALLASAMPIYHEMRADPEYETLGSVMNYSYAELWGGTFDVGHAYTIVPEHAAGEKLPLLVYLHGSGGNFKAYLRVLEGIATAHRCVVICPSFGFGNWGPGGAEAVERARAWAVANLPVNVKDVTLMGLSNGGIGVTRTLARDPKPYARAILVNAVVDGTSVKEIAEMGHWRAKPLLLVTGAVDNRVPLSYVKDYAEVFKTGGSALEMDIFQDQDHFLIFQKREAFQRDVSEWLARTAAGTGP